MSDAAPVARMIAIEWTGAQPEQSATAMPQRSQRRSVSSRLLLTFPRLLMFCSNCWLRILAGTFLLEAWNSRAGAEAETAVASTEERSVAVRC